MNKVTLCVCGCGEPATHASHHVSWWSRLRITEADYTVEDRGYKTACWIAKSKSLKNSGYANIRVARGQVMAHRAMYEQVNGPIPEGLWIDHLCRQKRCINPEHLEAVTPAVNAQRKSTAKLTPEKVAAIRAARGIRMQKDLASQYGVSRALISLVQSGKVWPLD